jgi:hypothetical protein
MTYHPAHPAAFGFRFTAVAKTIAMQFGLSSGFGEYRYRIYEMRNGE